MRKVTRAGRGLTVVGFVCVLVWILLVGFQSGGSETFNPGPVITLSWDPRFAGGYPGPAILGWALTVVLLGVSLVCFVRAYLVSRRR